MMALAFPILPVNIKLAGADGKSAFWWLVASYVLQNATFAARQDAINSA